MPNPDSEVLLGLMGHPIGHSQSPRLMEGFARAEQRSNLRYSLWDLPAWPASRLEWWESSGKPRGWNVTIPFKQNILPWLDAQTDSAQAVGAVNTVAVMPDGSWLGHNTDADGFWEALHEFPNLPAAGRALLLGGGGAARAVHFALTSRGWTVETAIRRAQEPWMEQTVAWESLFQVDLSRFQLVVNATPLGSQSAPNESPIINWESGNCRIHLMDLVYTPSPTRLMHLAAQQGWTVQDGSGMLRQQAKKAWNFWKSSGVIPEI